jgi:hypothetical protein
LRASHYATNNGAVTVHFSEVRTCDVVFYTGNEALAVELTDAINAVLAKHRVEHAEQKVAA